MRNAVIVGRWSVEGHVVLIEQDTESDLYSVSVDVCLRKNRKPQHVWGIDRYVTVACSRLSGKLDAIEQVLLEFDAVDEMKAIRRVRQDMFAFEQNVARPLEGKVVYDWVVRKHFEPVEEGAQ